MMRLSSFHTLKEGEEEYDQRRAFSFFIFLVEYDWHHYLLPSSHADARATRATPSVPAARGLDVILDAWRRKKEERKQEKRPFEKSFLQQSKTNGTGESIRWHSFSYSQWLLPFRLDWSAWLAAPKPATICTTAPFAASVAARFSGATPIVMRRSNAPRAAIAPSMCSPGTTVWSAGSESVTRVAWKRYEMAFE